MNTCKHCLKEKEESEFVTKTVCKQCKKERRILLEQMNHTNEIRNNKLKLENPEEWERRRKLKLENDKIKRKNLKELDKLNNPEKYKEPTEEELNVKRENEKLKNRDRAKEYRNKNKEKVKLANKNWRIKNKLTLRKSKQDYYFRNKKRDRKKRSENTRNYINNNPEAKFRQRLRSRINAGFKYYSKNGKTQSCSEYGIDFEEIYNKVGPKPDGNFHLDHIIPMSVFDFDNPEHVKLCNCGDNLRWVDSKENLIKWNKIYTELILQNERLVEICNIIGLDILSDKY